MDTRMSRVRSGGRTRGTVALRVVSMGCVAALAVAGCGSGRSSSTSTSTTSTASAAVNPAVVTLLEAQDVSVGGYDALIYAPAPTLAAEKTLLSELRDALYKGNLQIRKYTLPTASRTTLNDWFTANSAVVAALDQLGQKPSLDAIGAALKTQLTPALTKYNNAVAALGRALGIKGDPWYRAKAKGALIYTDSLSAPHGKIKWLQGANVSYSHGGLTISAVKGGNGQTGPTTPYTFDGRHIAVEVDAKPVSGQPFYGIQCPVPTTPAEGTLVGQVTPDGKWLIGIKRNPSSIELTAPTTNAAIKAGQVNRLRLDCDQFAPGSATARLYANGKLLGSASAPMDLTPNYEAGLAVISPADAASSAVFSNWSVYKLP